jgi:DNA repair protein RadA/Sms
MLAEIQALVTPSAAERPRRTTSGVDAARTAMVLAVLEARARVRLLSSDVFVSTVGGARVQEPAGDLATALAIASAAQGLVVPPEVIAIGEIGLAGELRRVPELERRLMEAQRIGFGFAIVPAGRGGGSQRLEGMEVLAAPDLRTALRVLDLRTARGGRPPHSRTT